MALKCVLFPLKDRRDIPNNTVLYNYYSYVSINFIQEGDLIKIGKFVDSNLQLTPDFLQYVKLFSLIDQCETEVKLLNPEFNSAFLDDDSKILKFSNLVKEKYLERISMTDVSPDHSESDSPTPEPLDETPSLTPASSIVLTSCPIGDVLIPNVIWNSKIYESPLRNQTEVN